ncbi:Glycine N-acyltransferase [Oryzias melastigma]|uniref:Glycine N-acyltransferase-like protein n=1 Tax=Oryzias melastigma TaxID=30732 RepID=A0A834F3R3_ORYME|nr:Glycine N-acyltransferase [Oryzias melastigma]
MELTEDQLIIAENEVKRYLPRSLKVYGFLILRNRVKSEPVTVLVDKWPKFRVIVCKPSYEKESDVFKDILIFANDATILEETIRSPSVFEWTRYLCIGTNRSHMEIIKAVAFEKNVPSNKLSECHVMILEDESRLPSIECSGFSSGFSLSSLDESHLDLVNQTWKFGKHDGTLGMIRNMIAHFPSRCMLDPEGKPVSWILTYACCAMGMLYTLPEHRGKGYAKAVISSMARTLKAQGYPVYCFVEEENAVSYQLFTSMGFTEDPSDKQVWFGFNKF